MSLADMNFGLLSKRYDEARLLNALRAGHRKAFEELYDRFAPCFLGVLTRIVQHPDQAQDLLQDSFVKIWQNIHRYDPAKGRLFTWMLRIVRNSAFDHLQRAKSSHEYIETIPLEQLGIVMPSYQTTGLTSWVRSILSIEQQHIIDLIYFRGYTRQEIADEFNLPVGTVKTRLRTALHRLRALENNNLVSSARKATKSPESQS